MPTDQPEHSRSGRQDAAQWPWSMNQNMARHPTASTPDPPPQPLYPQAHSQPGGSSSIHLDSVDRTRIQTPSHSQALSMDMMGPRQFTPRYLSSHSGTPYVVGPNRGPSSMGSPVQDHQPGGTLHESETHVHPTSADRPSRAAGSGTVLHMHNYHGAVNYIESLRSENTFAGTSYGPVLQNSAADSNWMDTLAQRLKISRKADYAYYPGGDESGLRRSGCTRGTRVPMLEGIFRWETNTSPSSESVFWLSGQAGAGKTAIAQTIAEMLVQAMGSGGSAINVLLGGSFFCSRHSEETRTAGAVVRTLVYRIAVRSPPFRAALMQFGDFETVDHGPRSQLLALLVFPWQKCEQERLVNHEPCLVNTIDALDELEGDGGIELLTALLDVLNEYRLSGLKFFVTSRLEPSLVQLIESFTEKQVCRLERVSIEQSSADIKLYLMENLAHFATHAEIEKLTNESGGLFIYAATVIEYLKGRIIRQQKSLLQRLLSLPTTNLHPRGATSKLDMLYSHILQASFVDTRDQQDPHIFQQCLLVLHTFLCTIERTSTVVATGLLNAGRREDEPPFDLADADALLARLHSVLYSQDGQVMWYHKSFPDFIFDGQRSQEFFCDQQICHRLLAKGCFGIMQKGLWFKDIGPRTTSHHPDQDNHTSPSSSHIPPTLSYACRNWSTHWAGMGEAGQSACVPS